MKNKEVTKDSWINMMEFIIIVLGFWRKPQWVKNSGEFTGLLYNNFFKFFIFDFLFIGLIIFFITKSTFFVIVPVFVLLVCLFLTYILYCELIDIKHSYYTNLNNDTKNIVTSLFCEGVH